MIYSHQKKIIDDNPEKTGLFLGTGTGKTRTALLLARGRTLVVCPKTQREDKNWQRELEKIENPNKITLIVISKEEFRKNVDFYIKSGCDTLIVDEAHTCLGMTPNTRWRKKQQHPKSSQLFDALYQYVKEVQPPRFYLCTATIVKSPFTVFAAAVLLGKTVYDLQGFFQFRWTFYTRLPMPGREVWVPKKDSATKDKLAYFVRSIGYVGRLSDYFDVPEQTFKTHHIELTAAQKARLKELPYEYPEPIVRVGKRHQVENGVLSGDEFAEGQTFDNGKIDAILEYAAEFPRMVIFAKYRAQIDQIAKALTDDGYIVRTLTGDTKERGSVIAEANKLKECVFIAQAQVSSGWELPDFPVMIFASCTYSFVDRMQGEGRILRANQLKKNLYIDLVVRGGIDEAVHEALINKRDFDERVYIKDTVEYKDDSD